MRVISGSAKGLRLVSPGQATRPITDRVKENLFNILGDEVEESSVLDLFAGAGSVGIEALSRGARTATFVENDAVALRALRENLRLTRLGARATVVPRDVFQYLRQPPPSPFELIYVAPPQYRALWIKTIRAIDGRPFLGEDGVLVAQIFPKEYEELTLERLELTDERQYGSTRLLFYRPRVEEPGQ